MRRGRGKCATCAGRARTATDGCVAVLDQQSDRAMQVGFANSVCLQNLPHRKPLERGSASGGVRGLWSTKQHLEVQLQRAKISDVVEP